MYICSVLVICTPNNTVSNYICTCTILFDEYINIIIISAAAKSSFFSAAQTGLTSLSNHVFLVALGLLYMRNAVDIAEYDGELRN